MQRETSYLDMTARVVNVFLGDGPETRVGSITLDELTRRVCGASTKTSRRNTVRTTKRAMPQLKNEYGMTVLTLTWGAIQDARKLLPTPGDERMVPFDDAALLGIKNIQKRHPGQVAVYVVASPQMESAVLSALARDQGIVKSYAQAYKSQVEGSLASGGLDQTRASRTLTAHQPVLTEAPLNKNGQ